jgi:PAP2 superfamily
MDSLPATSARDADWVVPCAAFVALQHIVALVLSRSLHFSPVPPTTTYVTLAALLTVLVLLAALSREMWRMVRSGEERPAACLAGKIAKHWSELLIYAAGFQLVALQVAALTWIKGMLPLVIPFWADPYLARIDFALFAGDPSRFLRWAIPLVEPVYISWLLVKVAALIAILSLPASAGKSRAMMAYFLTVGVVGVCGQFLISSAGPLFYSRLGFGDAYEPLLAGLAHSGRNTIGMADYLWSTYSGEAARVGTGISAMPSMHVAVAVWIFLAARKMAPKIKWIAFAYALLIFVGSFTLGWHYVSDAVIGAAAALAAWKAAALLRLPSSRTPLQPAYRRG